ncbi:hypothetical protein ACHAXT_008859 [Thalassiosira profunda]
MGSDTQGNTRCGACTRLLLFLLPLLGCACILGSLALLSLRLGVSITDASISTCLADYDTVGSKVEVLIPIFVGASLMFVATKMRNIQVNEYHRRQRTESKCRYAMNLIAAISNVLAYGGFVLLALFDLDGPGNAPLIHEIGSYVYFILSGVYGVLHAILLCKQVQYPMLCKVIFATLPVATIACTIIYVTKQDELFVFEWISVALAAINVGLISVLFLVDPVDDELRDFFCCRRAGRDANIGPSKARRLT